MSEAEQTPETPPAPDPAETEARAKGWVPKEEYKGKRDWKPADEWLADGDEIAQLRRELKETKDAFIDFGRQNREAALAEARAKREAELDNAVEAGDKDAARKAAAELKKVAPAEPELSPPAKDFIERNKEWFGFHQRATDLAHSLSRRYDSEGLPPEEGLAKVQEAINERFPELFTNTHRDRAPSVDSGGTPRTGRRNKGHGLTINDLPEAYQKIARQFVKKGDITEEKYIQDLLDTGAISKI